MSDQPSLLKDVAIKRDKLGAYLAKYPGARLTEQNPGKLVYQLKTDEILVVTPHDDQHLRLQHFAVPCAC